VNRLSPPLQLRQRRCRMLRASRGRRDKQRLYRRAAERSSKHAPSVASVRSGSAIRLCAGIRPRNQVAFFYDGRRTTVCRAGANGTQLFNTPTGSSRGSRGDREPFDDESIRSICERFLCRRFSGYFGSSPADGFIPAFFEKICLDRYRRDLSLSGPNTQERAYVCSTGGKWLALWLN
jgi:hypothetical protein